MNQHFRERDSHVFSRRDVLRSAVIASAIAASTARTEAFGGDEPPSTLDDQLAACVNEMKNILAIKYPDATAVNAHFDSRDDGSFRFTMQGSVKFQHYDGDGAYIVSRDGRLWEYLVREEPVVTLSGRSLGYSHYYGRARLDDGSWDQHETFVVNFVKKLD
jgi:hypothetical protein